MGVKETAEFNNITLDTHLMMWRIHKVANSDVPTSEGKMQNMHNANYTRYPWAYYGFLLLWQCGNQQQWLQSSASVLLNFSEYLNSSPFEFIYILCSKAVLYNIYFVRFKKYWVRSVENSPKSYKCLAVLALIKFFHSLIHDYFISFVNFLICIYLHTDLFTMYLNFLLLKE